MIAHVCVCKGGRRGKEQAEGGRARRCEDGVGEDGVGEDVVGEPSAAASAAARTRAMSSMLGDDGGEGKDGRGEGRRPERM